MIDIESHRIIDLLDSRDKEAVTRWLKTFPNIQVVSRDGSLTYSSAISDSHPNAIQVSDRFHLLKNLSEALEKYMLRLFPARLEIPRTEISQTPEMKALLDTRNRAQRIRFAKRKHSEGFTISEIALVMHASISTIRKYISIREDVNMKRLILTLLLFILILVACNNSLVNNTLQKNYNEEQLYPVRKGEKWGYIDSKGNVAIKPQFQYAQNFSSGLAAVRIGGKTGYINKNGEIVIEPQFDDASFFDGDVAAFVVREDTENLIGFINKSGKIILEPRFKYVGKFSEGLAYARIGDKNGYIDKNFKMVIEEQFYISGDFHEGLARVKKDNLSLNGYIDKSGNFIIKDKFYSALDFSEGFAAVQLKETMLWGVINKKGEFVIEPKYKGIGSFKDGLAGVKIDDKYGFMDINEKIIIQPQFDWIKDFNDGYAAVAKKVDKNDTLSTPKYKWGFIDKKGNLVIDYKYDEVFSFENGVSKVFIGKEQSSWKEGYIDKTGEYIWEPN